MKITSVTYRTNRPTPGSKYVHEHVEATALLGRNESPAEALEKLKVSVRAMLYPELVDLRERLHQVAPTVAQTMRCTSDAELAELYSEHMEEFAALLNGDMAPSLFVDQVLS